MAATILEIARKLNLSHTTVSRVLNNKSNVFVAEKTRERVLRAAREVGYAPNLAARSLRDSRTNLIAIFGSPYAGVWGGITPEILRGTSRVLHTLHYDLFFAFSELDDKDERTIPSWRFDGAILLQAPTQSTLRFLHEGGQPFVCVNEQVEQSSAILCDEAVGVHLALEHLWQMGHRRIAYIPPTTWHLPHYSVIERHEAYLSFLAARAVMPIPGHDSRLEDSDRTEFVRSAVAVQGATAILAYDNVVAVRIIAAACQLGLRIPQDFSLICFNDEFPVRDIFPALTVVAPRGEEMGERGSELLVEHLTAADPPLPTTIRLPPQLIVRASTAPVSQPVSTQSMSP